MLLIGYDLCSYRSVDNQPNEYRNLFLCNYWAKKFIVRIVVKFQIRQDKFQKLQILDCYIIENFDVFVFAQNIRFYLIVSNLNELYEFDIKIFYEEIDKYDL